MICVVLAAGYATRMYPLTENFPKPLLKVGQKTILDYLVDDIAQNTEVKDFVVVSNHKFISCFENWKTEKEGAGRNICIKLLDDGSVCNENRVGAVRDILLAIDTEKINDDILVIAGDNLLDFSLSSFVSFFNRKKSSCIMRYCEEVIRPDKKYSVCAVDEDDTVLYMREKIYNPESRYSVPPFYIYTKNDLEKIRLAVADNCPYDAPGSLVEYLCSRTKMYAMVMPGKRYDVGTLETYEKIKDGSFGGSFESCSPEDVI